MQLEQNFLFDVEKLSEYWASVVNVVSHNPCVGPFPRIKIYFFLLWICTDELILIPELMIFSPTLLPSNKYFERESNSIPQLLYTYLSGSAFLDNLTPPIKQSFKIKLEFNIKQKFEFLYRLIAGEKLLSLVVGVVSFWLTNL